MNVLEKLIHFDLWLFSEVNGKWTNGYFDVLFPYLRESIIWLPLYLFLLVFILQNFGKKGAYWSLAFICTASICDIVSSHVIKETIIRIRPCRSTSLVYPVRFLVNYCPMSSSFVSSHAANHFGMAAFIYTTLRSYIHGWATCFYVWAAIISYAQVYVGVHYPFDVACGALVGCLLGYIVSTAYNKHIGLLPKLVDNR